MFGKVTRGRFAKAAAAAGDEDDFSSNIIHGEYTLSDKAYVGSSKVGGAGEWNLQVGAVR
ncbi:hypothetical protein AA106556_1250 [Neokomagataea tanensis NBRC 106556]|uniref:Uncharacterized protein n=1 Tax=Neokomagataea tanensis NBRC 106556 TaxID=1223519 RepID=A0ABQ0QJA0_9PROT|nr:hypothetical protein AA106556_1250 [Neokomagataea tanensis NBRC 106556]